MHHPTRFLHTADWQLGLRAHFIPGDAGAIVRNERFQTLHRIGEVARETEAEFVVVAGDVFEHHGLRPDTLLALGDWHGLLSIDDRTWYSGTPAATRFKEKDPGHVQVVARLRGEIAGKSSEERGGALRLLHHLHRAAS